MRTLKKLSVDLEGRLRFNRRIADAVPVGSPVFLEYHARHSTIKDEITFMEKLAELAPRRANAYSSGIRYRCPGLHTGHCAVQYYRLR